MSDGKTGIGKGGMVQFWNNFDRVRESGEAVNDV